MTVIAARCGFGTADTFAAAISFDVVYLADQYRQILA